jgi:hypothetical protein
MTTQSTHTTHTLLPAPWQRRTLGVALLATGISGGLGTGIGGLVAPAAGAAMPAPSALRSAVVDVSVRTTDGSTLGPGRLDAVLGAYAAAGVPRWLALDSENPGNRALSTRVLDPRTAPLRALVARLRTVRGVTVTTSPRQAYVLSVSVTKRTPAAVAAHADALAASVGRSLGRPLEDLSVGPDGFYAGWDGTRLTTPRLDAARAQLARAYGVPASAVHVTRA